jgi:hypothetical protein
MGQTRIEYNRIQHWSLTDEPGPGPTSDITIRGNADLPLPETSHTSGAGGNVVWLDPYNGNDSYDGYHPITLSPTEGSKRTLQSALAAVDSTHTTIHIHAPYVSASQKEIVMTEALTGITNLPANLEAIQSDVGRIARVTFTGAGWLDATSDLTLNGVDLRRTTAGTAGHGILDTQSGCNLTMKWCKMRHDAGTALNCNGNVTVEASWLEGSGETPGSRNLEQAVAILNGNGLNTVDSTFILATGSQTAG